MKHCAHLWRDYVNRPFVTSAHFEISGLKDDRGDFQPFFLLFLGQVTIFLQENTKINKYYAELQRKPLHIVKLVSLV